jgi:hypothetical protein
MRQSAGLLCAALLLSIVICVPASGIRRQETPATVSAVNKRSHDSHHKDSKDASSSKDEMVVLIMPRKDAAGKHVDGYTVKEEHDAAYDKSRWVQ